MQIVIALIALSFLIIVHEFGHFIVAKMSGIKVHEFSLFMGPKLFSTQRGETVYSLRAVPLGGFVRMEGEEEASEDSRAFNKKPLLIRAAVIAAGPIMNLIVAVLIIFIIFSVSGFNTTVVSEIATDSPAYDAGIQKGDKVVKYNGKSIYNQMDLYLFLLMSKGKPTGIEVIRGNEQVPLSISPEIIPKNRFILGFRPKTAYGEGSNVVGDVTPGTQAYIDGLRANDEIIMINGIKVSNNRQIREVMNTNKDNVAKVKVLRDGKENDLKITPTMDRNEEQYDIGLDFAGKKGDSVGEVIYNSFIDAYSISRNVYYSLAGLITGKFSMSQMSGPVGIVATIGDVVKQSPSFGAVLLNLLSITSFISINLGLFNLIPFPALDGSKLLLIAVEGVRRKAIPPEKEAYISMIGLVLLIMLMIFATYNDILRFIGKG